MSRDVTQSDRPRTGRHRITRRAREDQRVAAFLTAIRATAAPATRPLQLVPAPRGTGRRTDTNAMPRIILTASAQL